MAKAHVDPAELRKFARELNRTGQDVQTLMMNLHAKLRELQKTWRDQQQQRFAEEFEQTIKTLRKFLESSERHVAYLQQRAGHIEEYLQQR
ncbi:MAG: WXG100 family type VII secretion target [Planctomycetota bacterium]|nr:MAG: WXG100 family type VII secretion target [Planctomycetota bacterium]